MEEPTLDDCIRQIERLMDSHEARGESTELTAELRGMELSIKALKMLKGGA